MPFAPLGSEDSVEVRVASNGMLVGLDRMPGTQSVGLGFWCTTGSRDEHERCQGITHFVEHMLFRGTRKRTSHEVNCLVDEYGAELSAYTGRESMVAYARAPRRHVDHVASLLAEVLSEPRLHQDDIGTERDVILEELEAAFDTPDDMLMMELLERLYPHHPMGRETLGTSQTLEAIDQSTIREHHRTVASADRICLAVVGDVEMDWAIELASHIPNTGLPVQHRAKPHAIEPSMTRSVRPIEQHHVAFGYRAPDLFDEARTAAVVLNHLLGDSPSSRLYRDVRDERGLSYSVGSAYTPFSDTGMLTTYAATRPETAEEVASLLGTTLEALAKDGPTEEEMRSARGALVGSLLMSADDMPSRLARLGGSLSVRGRAVPIEESEERLHRVSAEDVSEVARRMTTEGRVECHLGPHA